MHAATADVVATIADVHADTAKFHTSHSHFAVVGPTLRMGAVVDNIHITRFAPGLAQCEDFEEQQVACHGGIEAK